MTGMPPRSCVHKLINVAEAAVDIVDLGCSYAPPETPRPEDHWPRSWTIRPSRGSGGRLPQSRLSSCRGSCRSYPTRTARNGGSALRRRKRA